MRTALKPTTALVAVLLSLILAACGGSGDSSTTTDSATSNPTASREGAPAKTQENGGDSKATQGGSGGNSEAKQNGSSGNSDAKQDGSGGGKQSSGSKSPKAHSRAEVSTPLKVSGGGSAPLIVKGGDNSIQEFGEESSESDLREAAEAVHGFFVARATGEWAKACSYMSASLREQSEQLVENKDCAAFLEGFTTALPASTWREITTIDAGSLRNDGEQAFLIYYGAPGKTVYAMPMKNEGGWKVGALAGNALPGTG